MSNKTKEKEFDKNKDNNIGFSFEDHLKNLFNLSATAIISLITAITGVVSVLTSTLLNRDYSKNLWLLILLVCLVVFVIVFLIIYLKKFFGSTNKKYDKSRESLESDIIAIQKRLSNSEEQWKNSYHLILSSQKRLDNQNDYAIQNLKFLKRFGLTKEEYCVDKTLVFYLTSFSSEYDATYLTCKRVCEKMSLNLLRGDEKETTGDIFSQIIRYIVKSSLVIVNIDGKNPNVFYELGIAHALGKNTMFISKRSNQIPFDVRQYRIVFYKDESELNSLLLSNIKKYLYPNEHFIDSSNSQVINQSIEELEKTLSIDPQNLDALENLSSLYFKIQEYDTALSLCHKLLELKPDDEHAILLCGKINRELGKYEKALKYFERLLEINPNNNNAISESEKLHEIKNQ